MSLVLLLGSVIYTAPASGKEYVFLTLFYEEEMQTLVQYGKLSVKDILMGYRVQNYLWMFCPIIVGIPCILTQKIERFELFRTSKNRYFLSKYISNLVLGGWILVSAHFLFALASTAVVLGITALAGVSPIQEEIWDIYLVQKFLSLFLQGMKNALLGIILAEFLRNKYLILCIPFVWNYFISTFISAIIPYSIWRYISPSNYEMLFYHEPLQMNCSIALLVVEILTCGILIKFTRERRYDCGQR